jgi:hypothetical protein
MFKQVFAVLFMCASVLAASTQGAQAAPNESKETRSDNPSLSEPVSQVMSATRQEEVEAKRQAIEEKVAEKKEAITEKLSGKANERCEQREETINTVLENRVVAAQRHLENFEAIEAKLTKFVAYKNLDLENAGLVEAQLTTAATEVRAKINAIQAVSFACEEASAAAPGAIVKTQISDAKQALKDYRDAIKEYALAVKSAVAKETETNEETAQ